MKCLTAWSLLVGLAVIGLQLLQAEPLSVQPVICPVDLPVAGERKVQIVNPAGADDVRVRFAVPISDIQQIWSSDLNLPFQDRKWRITKLSGPQRNIPFLACFNLAERNVFSFGSASLEWDNQITSKINQEKGVYEIELRVVAGPKGRLRPFAVTFDRRPVVWTKALADWRDSLPYPKGRYPAGVWDPVYCSWYAVHGAVSQDWTERTARIATQMGFGTFILDDGWSYDEAKRVNPETAETWYRDIGDWATFSSAKFPDFKAHRERIRALGLKYVVWVAPYLVGARSEAYRRWGFDKTHPKVRSELRVDISNDKLMATVTDQLVRLLQDSDLDGLKIDFLDTILPSVEKPCGAMTLAYVEEMMRQLREIKPDGLFEYRQYYCTPLMAHLGTQFRANDVPFEWIGNFQRLANIRLVMGDGIPVHADPIYWSDSEMDENIDRHFMAAMVGVPMLSMDLEKMSSARRKKVSDWLVYYRRRIEPFQRNGKWDVCYRNGGLAAVIAELPDDILLIVNGPISAELSNRVKGRRFTVFNLGYESVEIAGATVAPARAFPADPADETESCDSCDVLVVGGGVAGTAAALQAGRAGARTVLVERGGMVGGDMTVGGVTWPGVFHAWGRQVVDGCGWELVTNCVALAGGQLPDFSQPTDGHAWRHQVRVNGPLWVALAEEALTRAQVDLRYHTQPVSLTSDDTGWTVVLCADGERMTIRTKQIVDCTGNGAVAALVGAGRMDGGSVRQPGALTYCLDLHTTPEQVNVKALDAACRQAVAEGRLLKNDIRRGFAFFIREQNNTLDRFKHGNSHGSTQCNYIEGADNSTAALRGETNRRGRASLLRVCRFLREQPGLEKTEVVWMAPETGVRETRRVVGDYVLTGEDYVSARQFSDAVCHAFYPIDLHDAAKGGAKPRQLEEGKVPSVPLRALTVKGAHNLLVAGRCLSSDRAANGGLRIQAACMATGQAAGEAAALAAELGCDARDVPLDELKRRLKKSGHIVPSCSQ